MHTFRKIMLCSGIVVALVTFEGASALAAGACKDVSYAVERGKLQQLLSANDALKPEQTFLLNGAGQRVREIGQKSLNERGVECGVEAVRALIFACASDMLPSSLRSMASPNRKTGKRLWGKPNVSAREAAFIGVFHACRAAAAESFLSGG